MTKSTKTPAQAKRKQLMAQIHIAKNQLNMDDDNYRDVLKHITGKDSCREMKTSELVDVVKEMKRLGFKPSSTDRSVKKHGKKPSVTQSKEALISKIEAMIADLNLSWDYVHGMANRMFAIERVQWLDEQKLYKLTQALAVYQRKQKVKQFTS